MSESAGLFASASAASKKRQEDGEPAERRVKLRKTDCVAAQAFNPWGEATIAHSTLGELWTSASEGSTAAMFHTELAATAASGGDYRVGIGMSRTAEVLLVAIDRLRDDKNLESLLVKQHRARALEDAKQIEPHLRILYAGKGSQESDESAKGMARLRLKAAAAEKKGEAVATPAQTKAAAEAFHDWPSCPNEESPLRALLFLLSAEGIFYAAHVAEKTGRAWVACKPATKEDAVSAALARVGTQAGASSSAAGAASSEARGLFK